MHHNAICWKFYAPFISLSFPIHTFSLSLLWFGPFVISVKLHMQRYFIFLSLWVSFAMFRFIFYFFICSFFSPFSVMCTMLLPWLLLQLLFVNIAVYFNTLFCLWMRRILLRHIQTLTYTCMRYLYVMHLFNKFKRTGWFEWSKANLAFSLEKKPRLVARLGSRCPHLFSVDDPRTGA